MDHTVPVQEHPVPLFCSMSPAQIHVLAINEVKNHHRSVCHEESICKHRSGCCSLHAGSQSETKNLHPEWRHSRSVRAGS